MSDVWVLMNIPFKVHVPTGWRLLMSGEIVGKDDGMFLQYRDEVITLDDVHPAVESIGLVIQCDQERRSRQLAGTPFNGWRDGCFYVRKILA